MNLGFRSDRIVILSTESPSLKTPNTYNYWGSLHTEYVYDNTISTGVNLYNGMRYKIFAELFKQVDKKKTTMSVLGADFRTYTKLHRQIIWANRLAASTSFGSQKIVYYLGSMDDVIVPLPSENFNYPVPDKPDQHYAFQANATNVRGFIQNVRNGNSFAVFNSEIRVPLFRYIFNKPIRSDILNTFQVIGFTDAGTAWTGKSPYNK